LRCVERQAGFHLCGGHDRNNKKQEEERAHVPPKKT
jgi:hypothetical protein